jgi:hypothetical protein
LNPPVDSKRMRRVLLAVPLLVLLLSVPAAAQSDDAAYCAQLGALALRYLTGGTNDGRGVPDLETAAAINDCNKGNTATGIKVLERKLVNNRFTLPKRS